MIKFKEGHGKELMFDTQIRLMPSIATCTGNKRRDPSLSIQIRENSKKKFFLFYQMKNMLSSNVFL